MKSIFKSMRLFLGYLSSKFKLFNVVLALSLLVLALEYAATSLMIPMSPGGGSGSSFVTNFWHEVANSFMLPLDFGIWLWIFLVLMFFRLILGFILTVLTADLGKQVHRDLSGRIFKQILCYEPMTTLYTRPVGHYVSLAGDDTFRAGTLVTNLLQALVGLATSTVGMLVLFQFSHQLFIWILGFLVVCLIFTVGLVRWMGRLNRMAINSSRLATTTFVEALNSIRSLRTFHAQLFVLQTYANQMRNYLRNLVAIEAVKSGIKALPATILILLAACVLRPGQLIDFSEATLFAATVIIIRVFSSLGQMATACSQLLNDMRSLSDIGNLVQLSADESLEKVMEKELGGVNSLRLENVCFGYGGDLILNNVSFSFQPGNVYAIIGPSGSGKSTLADLMLGLSIPLRGQILINNTAISMERFHEKIFLVEQQPKIFSASVRDNLLLGLDLDEASILKAIDDANLGDLIEQLPNRLDALLSYQGENFSGGQRQRIGIARALLRQPEVLILDEATSALDPKTRDIVIRNLQKKMKAGILIFITHDPAVANYADEVFPVGKIAKESD
jgi:ABC-type bacteriocin/lantibiotic exporter with double-glycine peptidase domain